MWSRDSNSILGRRRFHQFPSSPRGRPYPREFVLTFPHFQLKTPDSYAQEFQVFALFTLRSQKAKCSTLYFQSLAHSLQEYPGYTRPALQTRSRKLGYYLNRSRFRPNCLSLRSLVASLCLYFVTSLLPHFLRETLSAGLSSYGEEIPNRVYTPGCSGFVLANPELNWSRGFRVCTCNPELE